MLIIFLILIIYLLICASAWKGIDKYDEMAKVRCKIIMVICFIGTFFICHWVFLHTRDIPIGGQIGLVIFSPLLLMAKAVGLLQTLRGN